MLGLGKPPVDAKKVSKEETLVNWCQPARIEDSRLWDIFRADLATL